MKSIAISPNVKSFVLLFFARFFSFVGQRPLAASLAERSFLLGPRTSPTQCQRVASFLRLVNRKDEAKEYSKRVIALAAMNNRDVWYQAKAYAALGRPEEAIAYYQRYADLVSDKTQKYEALKAVVAHQLKMSGPHSAGRWKMVIDGVKEALAVKSERSVDWSLLGEAYFAVEEYEKALGAFDNARTRLPGDKDNAGERRRRKGGRGGKRGRKGREEERRTEGEGTGREGRKRNGEERTGTERKGTERNGKERDGR